jgi:hypothetical protein
VNPAVVVRKAVDRIGPQSGPERTKPKMLLGSTRPKLFLPSRRPVPGQKVTRFGSLNKQTLSDEAVP